MEISRARGWASLPGRPCCWSAFTAPSVPADPLRHEAPPLATLQDLLQGRAAPHLRQPGPPQAGARHRRGLETDPQALLGPPPRLHCPHHPAGLTQSPSRTPAPPQARALVVSDRELQLGSGQMLGSRPGSVTEGTPWGCVWAERDPGVPATLGSHWTPCHSFPWLL